VELMTTFAERLDRAINARLLGAACDTDAAREHAEREWKAFVDAEERRCAMLARAANAIDDVEHRFGDEYIGRLGELYEVRDEIRGLR
jgi:hypothetical protein